MDNEPPMVATISGAAEVDQAIATLVVAFGTEPVRAGCTPTPINICGTPRDYSKLLEQARLMREQRFAPAMDLA